MPRLRTEAAHVSDQRLSPDQIQANTRFVDHLVAPQPEKIVIFDDVITAGAHYVAARRVLGAKFPDVHISGVFFARRKVSEPDFSDFDDLDDL